MAELEDALEQVRQHWRSQGLRSSCVDETDLAELRQRRTAGLAAEYETFLRSVGVPDSEDRESFRFWPPAEVRETRDVLADAGYRCVSDERSVIIADYLQESWWYALWLDGPFKGSVSLVLGRDDGMDPQPPLGPFVDFLFAYVRDDQRLYPARVGESAPE